MKKMLAALAAAVLTAGIAVTASAADEVRVVVDGNELVTDQSAVVVNDRTLLPVRAVAEAVGAEVSWDDSTETATITTDEAQLIIELGSYSLTLNTPGVVYVIEMDVPAQTINDRTMIPVRIVAESLGLNVSWSEEANTAYLNSPNVITSIEGTVDPNGENSYNLFDCDVNTKWRASDVEYDAERDVYVAYGFSGSYAIFKLPQAAYVTGYTITTANDTAENEGVNPKTWTLYGCNASSVPDSDYSGWTVIDTVTDDTTIGAVNYTDYYFAVENEPDKYQYYMLKVFDNHGNYAMQMSEFSLAYENTKYSYGRTAAVTEDDSVSVTFEGKWNLITASNFKTDMEELFYVSYPRLLARFGDGSEPKNLTFRAVESDDDDGLTFIKTEENGATRISATPASTSGSLIRFNIDYYNYYPEDEGVIVHELTHVAQSYSTTLDWWTENMADYARFRYYHWIDDNDRKVYDADDETVCDWGYEPYGHCEWFFSYMDYCYPTTKDSAGNLNYGVIDAINMYIKNQNGAVDDDPYDTSTPINKLVKEITGYDCIESLRLQYVEDLISGKWTFTGFAGYADNFLTENLEGVDNPSYPSM